MFGKYRHKVYANLPPAIVAQWHDSFASVPIASAVRDYDPREEITIDPAKLIISITYIRHERDLIWRLHAVILMTTDNDDIEWFASTIKFVWIMRLDMEPDIPPTF
jgi:hypothetical protein